jgi:hypothetical protein
MYTPTVEKPTRSHTFTLFEIERAKPAVAIVLVCASLCPQTNSGNSTIMILTVRTPGHSHLQLPVATHLAMLNAVHMIVHAYITYYHVQLHHLYVYV